MTSAARPILIAAVAASLALAGCSRSAQPQQAPATPAAAATTSAKSSQEQTQDAVKAVCDVFHKIAVGIAKDEKKFVHETKGAPLSDPTVAPKADELEKDFRDGASKIDAAITPQVTDSLAENLHTYTAIVRKFADLLKDRGSDADFHELAAAVGGAADAVKPACGIKK